MLLTKEILNKGTLTHPVVEGGKMFRQKIGEYEISIVGGGRGLYGDFEKTFELAIFNEKGGFETVFLNTSFDDVESYITLEEINDIIIRIPR